MLKSFATILYRDMCIVLNTGSRVFMPIVYMLLIITFFSISLEGTTVGGYDNILPQIIWLSCLLVCLLNMDSLFKEDYEDGTLDGIVINSEILEISILAKVVAHWMFTIIPLVLVAFFANLLLTSNLGISIILFSSLILGTLTLSLIGSIVASLTLSLKGNGLLLSTIVLPLDIPILIFGTSAIYNASIGVNYDSEMLFLTTLLVLFLIIAPFAASFGIRSSLD
tara:strand:- start:139 stop:810 length:672 start_codon:yes stop_codon:yes gene_type:complete